MYLTDIRGFTAEDDIFLYPVRKDAFADREGLAGLSLSDGGVLFRGQHGAFPDLFRPFCRITIHGMGFRGDRGLSLHFARFCRLYEVEPRFLSMSDMGIAFFVPAESCAYVLDALCAYFPMWA